MRSVIFAIAASAILAPLTVHAAFAPLVKNKGCTAAMAGDPTSQKSFSLTTPATEIKSYLDAKVTCPSACFDETVTLDVSMSGINASVKGINKCTKTEADPRAEDPSKDKRGCGSGLTAPSATVVITGAVRKVYPPKSRCDSNNLSAAIDAVSKGDYQGALSALERLAEAPEPVPELPGGIAANQSLIDAFKKLDYTDEQAKAIIDKNPTAAADYINAIARNDKEAIAQNATKLGLNSDITDEKQRAVLEAIEESTPKPEWAQEQRPTAEKSGFTTDPSTGLPVQCGIPGIPGLFMRAESACGRINHNPLSSVQGPFHYLCDTWRRDTAAVAMSQYSDCSYRNDVGITTQVVDAVYKRHEERYGDACKSAGLSWTSCAYGIHVFGENGFQRIYSEYLRNPSASALSLCGTAISTAACRNNVSIFRNGGTVAGVFGELDRRLGGTSVIGSVAYSGSPVSVFGNTNTYTSLGGSPFAYSNPFYSPSVPPPANVTSGGGASTGGSIPMGGTIPTGTSISVGGIVGEEGATPGASAIARPVASIIVQPKEPARGGAVVVSWSTVGMRLSEPCRVLIATTTSALMARGNDGSKTITLGSSGTYTFTLECRAVSGIDVRQATSVLVK